MTMTQECIKRDILHFWLIQEDIKTRKSIILKLCVWEYCLSSSKQVNYYMSQQEYRQHYLQSKHPNFIAYKNIKDKLQTNNK